MLRQELADIRVGPADPLADEVVEVADHLAVRGQVLRAHRADGLRHAGHVLVQHLATETTDELVEPLACVRLQEVVVLQAAQPLTEVRRQVVELVQPARRDVAQHRPEGGILGRPARGLVEPTRDPGPFVGHDLVQLAPDVAQDVAEPVALQRLLAPPLEAVHQVAQPGQVRTGRVARPPAALHQPTQRFGEVALGHHVVGKRLHDLVGGEVRDDLRPVPAREPGPPGQRGEGVAVADRGVEIARIGRVRGHPGPSSVVDGPADHPFLVDPPGEVQALEQELDGGRDDGRFLGTVGHVVRAQPVDRARQTGDLAHPGHVLLRRRAFAGLHGEAIVECLHDGLQVVDRRRAG